MEDNNGYIVPEQAQPPKPRCFDSPGWGAVLGGAIALGAAFAALFCKAGGRGLNIALFALLWCIFITTALNSIGRWKNGLLFYQAGVMLLALTDCITVNKTVWLINGVGIFLLSALLVLSAFHDTARWDVSRVLSAFLSVLAKALGQVLRPFEHLCAAVRIRDSRRSQLVKSIIIGLAVSVPLVIVVGFLLGSADSIFGDILAGIFNWEMDVVDAVTTAVKAAVLFAIGMLGFYCTLSGLSENPDLGRVRETAAKPAAIAVTFTSVLALLYLFFCFLQVRYLFYGIISGRGISLPTGVSYAQYARTGFFQLLAVSILNALLVVFCTRFFRKNKALNIVLTVISACTYILIASSALRMALYVGAYGLTFLRILVLWFLPVLAVLMTGITVSIYSDKFPLFRVSLTVGLVCWLVFASAKPDRVVAEYNIRTQGMTVDTVMNIIWDLSPDAAPVLWEHMDEYNENNYLHADVEDYFSRDIPRTLSSDFRAANLAAFRAAKAADSYVTANSLGDTSKDNSGEKGDANIFCINFLVACPGVHSVRYEYYLGNDIIGGGGVSYADGSEISMWDTLSKDFTPADFPPDAEISELWLEVFASDKDGTEFSCGPVFPIAAQYGNKYTVQITGSRVSEFSVCLIE